MKIQETTGEWYGVKRIFVWVFNEALNAWELDKEMTEKRNGCSFQSAILTEWVQTVGQARADRAAPCTQLRLF